MLTGHDDDDALARLAATRPQESNRGESGPGAICSVLIKEGLQPWQRHILAQHGRPRRRASTPLGAKLCCSMVSLGHGDMLCLHPLIARAPLCGGMYGVPF